MSPSEEGGTVKLRHAISATLALVVVGLGGCVSSRPASETLNEERVCVNIRQINSYAALDDQHVFVKVTGRDNYLLTVENVCSGLTFARGIAISDKMSRVCGDGFGILVFMHPGVGSKRCRILKIETVADKDAAQALIESGPSD